MTKPLKKTDLAKHLGVSVATINAWLYQGRLPHSKIGRLVRFSASDVEQILTQTHVPATVKTEEN